MGIGKRNSARTAHGFRSVADEVGQRFMDMGFVAEKRRIVARGNLKGQRRSVRGFVDELIKQRAHVAEIGFQRDAVGVRFCAAN